MCVSVCICMYIYIFIFIYIYIYLRQLRLINRQVIINPTIERRRGNRPKKREIEEEKNFSRLGAKNRSNVSFVVSFRSFSSSMTRAETSSIEKAYITGARISGTRRASSRNTEASPFRRFERTTRKSTSRKKRGKYEVCAGDEITVPLSFHYLYSLRSIDNKELRTRQVSNGHRLTNETRITRFDRIVDHPSTILIVCTCFFFSFFSLFSQTTTSTLLRSVLAYKITYDRYYNLTTTVKLTEHVLGSE